MRKLSIPFILLSVTSAQADVPRVVTDIAPVHSLVEQVMTNVGPAEVLLRPGASAHDFAFKPSDARKLQGADVAFWVGEELTPWLARPIETLADEAVVIELFDAEGVHIIEFSENADDDDHKDHANDTNDHDDEHEQHAHDHHGVDPHLWLDPHNAQVWLKLISEILSDLDPENAPTYRANANAAIEKIDAMVHDIEGLLVDAPDFAVTHDSLGYFSNRFGLAAPLALADSEANRPGPARISEIRHEASHREIVCVLSEPGTSLNSVETVFEGQEMRVIEFDPAGGMHAFGPDNYFQFMRSLADTIANCKPQ